MDQVSTARWVERIAKSLSIPPHHVTAVVTLLDEGATIPFISRYRKERTGSLDEVKITEIRDRLHQLQELDARKETIINTIEKTGNLTTELLQSIAMAETLAQLEDIYLPYKPKRKTRASIAREKGLEPLAEIILKQPSTDDILASASGFVDTGKGVDNVDDALAGARDIIAEMVNENPAVRDAIRTLFWKEGVLESRVIKSKEEEGQKYKDYFACNESLSRVPSHRLLAMRRGEKEGVLRLDISPPEDTALRLIQQHYVSGHGEAANQITLAIADSYKRLLKPSLETEVRMQSKMKADEEAIRVFAENLNELLLAAPLGQKNVLALDPGFRTGCKLVCLDRQGKLLHYDVIYPHEAQRKREEAAQTLKILCEKFAIEAISIGNGTAGRETEAFVKSIGLDNKIIVVMVNESGASVYSASDVAREEFPDKDVTVRGAVSIGRRLMDPLAELVKIDAKSIGVGQYQHDVDQVKLKTGLDDTVIHCVNAVGVEVNTASKELLSYVSGLTPAIARNIVEHRNSHGPFRNRQSLLEVSRLGEKVFEQAAGFLRISDADNPLDASAVHPESYPIVEKMAADANCSVKELMASADIRKQLDLTKYVTDTVGLPTLNDILHELEKPGRDPRKEFEVFSFTDGVNTIQDLTIGMKLPGIVTNVTKFGAFVDVGVHQDGLVHISHLADKFVKDPADVVSVQQKVQVTVTEVDVARKRIGLSMRQDPFGPLPGPAKASDQPKRGHAKGKSKPKAKEPTMEEKLAQLLNKYKR